ncbi:MAG TPA: hypothetical protein VHA76_01400 [Solirubrobacterales bacterium]|nr:hypothetical protein [Solirubrobacterales bacterium]
MLACALFASSAGAATVAVWTVPAGDYAGMPSPLEPMIAAPGGGGEWFVVDVPDAGGHGPVLLEEPTTGGTPDFVHGLVDLLGGTFVALAQAQGGPWGLSTDSLFELPVGGGPSTDYPGLGHGEPQDAATGPDGLLYWTAAGEDAIVQTEFSAGIPEADTAFALPGGYGHPEAIASARGRLWFTTASDQLGSVTTAGAFSVPYTEGPGAGSGTDLAPYPHTLAADGAGHLWAVGGGASADQILEIDAGTGATAATFTAGLPAAPGVSALAVGPEGDIWFTEGGAQQVGELDPASGAITSYPLPPGYRLPAAGDDVIAAGPPGSGTVFFGAQTSTGEPAIGIVGAVAQTTTSPEPMPGPSGTPPSTTPTASPGSQAGAARTARVSAAGLASVVLTCAGTAPCRGRLTLSLHQKERGRRHGKTSGKTVTTVLGAASYDVAAGSAEAVAVKLDKTGRLELSTAGHHTLTVTLTLQPAGGKASARPLRLRGVEPSGPK